MPHRFVDCVTAEHNLFLLLNIWMPDRRCATVPGEKLINVYAFDLDIPKWAGYRYIYFVLVQSCLSVGVAADLQPAHGMS